MNTRQQSGYTPQHADMSRIIGLTDGLFATVLTLLVLDINLPEVAHAVGNAELFTLLAGEATKLMAYTLTFLVAGLAWVAHHEDFQHIERYDRRLLWINLMFLLSLGLLPFTTSLAGGHSTALAWDVYALDMICIGLTLAACWGYACATGLCSAEITPDVTRFAMLRHLITPAVFALSLPLSFVSLQTAALCPFLIPVVASIVRRMQPEARQRHEPAGGALEVAENRPARVWRIIGFTPLIIIILFVVWVALTHTQ